MKYNFLLYLIIMLFSVNVIGNTVNNITVTDIEGIKHDLYKYLDEGKHVLISGTYIN